MEAVNNLRKSMSRRHTWLSTINFNHTHCNPHIEPDNRHTTIRKELQPIPILRLYWSPNQRYATILFPTTYRQLMTDYVDYVGAVVIYTGQFSKFGRWRFSIRFRHLFDPHPPTPLFNPLFITTWYWYMIVHCTVLYSWYRPFFSHPPIIFKSQ